jgi:type III secretion protein D
MMAQSSNAVIAERPRADRAGAAGIVLRVLLGPMAGAEIALDTAAERVRVGHDLSADIVIRAPNFEGAAFDLSAIDEAAAEITVVSGAVRLGAFTLEPGVPALVPPFAPVFSGDTAIAIGPSGDEARWAAAAALAARQWHTGGAVRQEQVEGEPRKKRRLLEDDMREGGDLTERRPPWGFLLAGTAAGAVALLYSMTREAEPVAPAPDPAARLAAFLDGRGYEELAVSTAATGDLAIIGTLSSASEKAALEGLLAERGIRAHLNVTTEEKLLRQVEDVFRMNGVMATARRGGDGAVTVETALAPSARLSAIRAQIAQDMPDVGRLEIVSEEAPMPSPSMGLPDPRRRIVSVQGGQLGYLSIEGGDRLYPGATLPTGHRIKRIAGKTVTVEIGDQETVLTF